MLILVTKYCNKELSLSLGAMVIGNRENESAGTLKKGLKLEATKQIRVFMHEF